MDHFRYLSFVFVVFLSVGCSLVATCWESAYLLALLYVMFYCVLLLFHVVSRVRCGTWF